MKRTSMVPGMVIGALGFLLLAPGSVRAGDQPAELMPGRVGIVKPGRLAKFVGKAPKGSLFELPNDMNDPRTEGGTLDIFDTVTPGAGSNTYDLVPGNWIRLPRNEAKTLKGYKYRGAGSESDPCRVVLVKARVVKGVCRGAGVTLEPPFTDEMGVILTIGTDSKQYCASFGGIPSRNDETVFRRRKADAPVGSCPGVTVGTTTTSSIIGASTTSSTSTTSTTIGGACCGGASFSVFINGDTGPETCGVLLNNDGSVFNTLLCGGLLFGGGGNSVPLPKPTPDLSASVTEIVSCTGQIGILGPATSAQTGTIRNCTSKDCLFGAPLPLPNTASTPTSTCVINTVAVDGSGSLNCSSGEAHIDLPLTSEVFLIGDAEILTPGIQTCPRCTGGDPNTPLSGTCSSGTSSASPGAACTPGSTDQGGLAQYPTSHDCPLLASFSIGSIPIGFALDTGTFEFTATPATNDTGTPERQARVFCGYCRDADFTNDIPNDPFQQCWENGQPVGPACTQPNETCEQRNQGAYGPNGGAVKTISAIGTPAGSLVDGLPHDQALVSVFCIPPTQSPAINNAADLPGPGTVSFLGTIELCSTADPCPDGAP